MARRRLPPLNAVRAFEAASRHASFQAAADELAVTPGAVAQQVKSLEQWLGLPLFQRLPSRGVALTVAGQRYAAAVSELLDQLAAATAQVAERMNANVLTVSTIASFASQWLIPRLGSFRAAHPHLDVRVVASNTITDFNREDVDVAIRYGLGQYPGLASELLLKETFFPVCSPALLDAGEPPLRTADDLRHHTLLHEDVDPVIHQYLDWRRWLEAAGVEGVDLRRGPRFTHTYLALQAAAGGQGVALATSVLIGNDLATHRLVQPFGPEVPGLHSYHLVCPPSALAYPKVQAFRAWIRAAVEATL
ncbi:MAG TPA: transcriptional regulator GcvA [Microvirga sp.]|jgi:LysR family glycine cleavage system transcriptional activator|nr:transcriptional regulator GcvA [Microvirga sp.]